MFRIDADANVGNLFSEGDPAAGLPGTKVSAEWLNAVQEEICNLITAMGITLNKADSTQLADAVAAYIAAHNSVTSPHSATSLATGSRLVLRDANGRAQFQTPSGAADAATKGYVDSVATLSISGLVPLAMNAQWTGDIRYWSVGKLIVVAGWCKMTGTSTGAITLSAALPTATVSAGAVAALFTGGAAPITVFRDASGALVHQGTPVQNVSYYINYMYFM